MWVTDVNMWLLETDGFRGIFLSVKILKEFFCRCSLH